MPECSMTGAEGYRARGRTLIPPGRAGCLKVKPSRLFIAPAANHSFCVFSNIALSSYFLGPASSAEAEVALLFHESAGDQPWASHSAVHSFCSRQSGDCSVLSYGNVAAQRPSSGDGRVWQLRPSRECGTPRSGDGHLDGHGRPGECSLSPHGNVAAQRPDPRNRRVWQLRLSHECGTLRSGDGHLDGHGRLGECSLSPHGDVAAQRAGSGDRRL